MLRFGLVESVANLTPPVFHYPINLSCIDAKVHTYSKKPIAHKIKEIENLIKASQDNNIRFACSPATPLNPVLVKAKQFLNQGIIGKPCYAIGQFSHGGPVSQGYKISYYKNLISSW